MVAGISFTLPLFRLNLLLVAYLCAWQIVTCAQYDVNTRTIANGGNDKNLFEQTSEDLLGGTAFGRRVSEKYQELFIGDVFSQQRQPGKQDANSALDSDTRAQIGTQRRIKRNSGPSLPVSNIPTLLPWQPWSRCNVTDCESSGTQVRARSCLISGIATDNQQICQAALLQIRRCEVPCMGSGQAGFNTELNSRWNEWTQWSECSASCGEGTQTRNRNCSGESLDSCVGPSEGTRSCEISSQCPRWSDWSQWSTCSLTCGVGGMKYRERICMGSRPPTITLSVGLANEILKQSQNVDNTLEAMNSSLCPGGSESSEEVEPCVMRATCQRQWSQWVTWSPCSTTCGTGFSSATRRCLGDDSDGPACMGNNIRYRRCYSPPCWTGWSIFSACSRSCGTGGGTRTRRRFCRGISNIQEQYARCEGIDVESEACNTESCPVWGDWSRYGRCSNSCNGGRKTRTRRCMRGTCPGRNYDMISCNYHPCPSWSSWSLYTCCSVTCGENGVRERRRTCRYAYGRANSCIGPERERVPCSMQPCNETQPSVFASFECGQRNVLANMKTNRPVLRIFGGQVSIRHGWPWQASWQHKSCSYCGWIHFCGATLVAPQWVITASHCTEESSYRVNHNFPGDSWSVVLGMHRLYEDGERYFIRRVFVHPEYEYDAVTEEADIALLKLRRPATLTSNVTPACLPQMTRPTPGETCFITGWGYTGNAQLSVELLEAGIPMVSFEQCQNLGRNYRQYLSRRHHMCAGDALTAASDSCTGDSGGPLVCRRGSDHWYLAGVTSFGFTECGMRGHVGIYTPMANFERWARDTIENFSHPSC